MSLTLRRGNSSCLAVAFCLHAQLPPSNFSAFQKSEIITLCTYSQSFTVSHFSVFEAMAIPLGPQPDLVRLVQSVQDTATELGNFGNIPAVAQGNAILQQMQVMQQSQLQFQRHMRRSLRQIQRQIQQSQQDITDDITTLRQSHLAA